MSDWKYTITFCLVLGLVLLGAVVNIIGWKHCHDDGGTYVRAVTITGYSCIGENNE